MIKLFQQRLQLKEAQRKLNLQRISIELKKEYIQELEAMVSLLQQENKELYALVKDMMHTPTNP